MRCVNQALVVLLLNATLPRKQSILLDLAIVQLGQSLPQILTPGGGHAPFPCGVFGRGLGELVGGGWLEGGAGDVFGGGLVAGSFREDVSRSWKDTLDIDMPFGKALPRKRNLNKFRRFRANGLALGRGGERARCGFEA